jgi:hypothetical protein
MVVASSVDVVADGVVAAVVVVVVVVVVVGAVVSVEVDGATSAVVLVAALVVSSPSRVGHTTRGDHRRDDGNRAGHADNQTTALTHVPSVNE